ncbi:chemotaxis protein [Brachyspira hampsonii]|uniref:Chemotaxis protein n=1 Tax=Brachyspira hampsonii TaxID=1287055 RepID=A0A1E5NAJ0_9SPIR|nr:methyl-accepting chemotaxis protein [Brachyspira hampsonii]OEJ13189.1 chemotaxis protein [Brachyspira hampsonii]
MNDKKKKYILMLKFLLPFSIFITVIVISLLSYFIPRYKKEFSLEILSNINKNETAVSGWLNHFYSQIEVLTSYSKYETDYTQMLDSFKELQILRDDIKNIYFGSTVPYKDGGVLVIVFGDNLRGFDQTTREWYIEAAKNPSDIYITSPYKDAQTGETVITISKAVIQDNILKGVVGLDISFSQISASLEADKDNKFFIASLDGMFITHTDSNLLFNQQRNIYTELNAPRLNGSDYAFSIGKSNWTVVHSIANTPWLLVGNGSASSLNNKITTLSIIMVIVAIGFLLIEFILVMLNVTPLSQTLDRAIDVIKNMTDKHFNAVFDDKLLKKSDQTGVLVNSIQNMQKSLGNSIHSLQESLNFINNEIDTVSDGSTNLSDRTNTQASSLEELSSLIESLSSSLDETNIQSNDAKDMSVKVADATKVGVESSSEIISSMSEISESSKKISEMTKLIQSIAFQTNILALNAAVEAARAGDQGKGFAVVASEIRSLAQNVDETAKNITNTINDALDKVEAGNKAVENSSKILRDIESLAQDMLTKLSSISERAVIEADSINQINVSVRQLNSITGENSNLAEANASSTKEVRTKIEDMVEQINSFKF